MKTLIDSDPIQREYDWDSISPSVAILESIAVLEDREISEIHDIVRQPMGYHIDTEALDQLIIDGSSTDVSLVLFDYRIDIHDNTITIRRV